MIGGDNLMDEQNSNEETSSQASSSTSNKMNPLIIAVIVGAIIVVVIAVFMMNRSQRSEETSTQQILETESPVSTEEAGVGEGQVVDVKIEAGNFSFSPNTILAKRGQTVRVVLDAVDLQHDFTIDDLNVKSDLVKAGSSTTFEFIAGEVGEYEFYCSVGNHRAMGTVGTLTVEE